MTYTKFQQDALAIIGFADADPSAFNQAHGAGFAIESTQPYDRIVLVLPWRWVQGGGSAYQVGDYRGNPHEAGVFAIPAGMSLSQAQAVAATYRLAGLDDVLKQAQPHLYTASYRLQILAGGRWQVDVDINDDGQTDVVTDDRVAGNLPSPFPNLTERSGLLVSSRAAMSSKTGMVGRTTWNLIYHHDATGEQPITDRRPFTASIHSAMKSSPTIIDGTSWSATSQVTAQSPTLGASPVNVCQVTGSTQWFIDLPLDPDASTPVTFAQAGVPSATTISGSIWWEPVEMANNEPVTIRTGDSIKLRCAASCGARIVKIDADGDGTIDWSGPEVESFVHRYDAAGVFTARAWLEEDNSLIGESTITVSEVRLPKAIACQVGFMRQVTIHTGVHDPADLVITTNDPTPAKPSLMLVERGPAIENHLRIYLKALKRGTPILYVRQGSEDGPILAAMEVDEFTVDTSRAQGPVIDAHSRRTGVRIEIKPFIPNLYLLLQMFASTSSFPSGNILDTTTDAFVLQWDNQAGEYTASFHCNLNVPAGGQSHCFRGTFRQENQEIVDCGSTGVSLPRF